jgi:putative transcriptional regulator
VARSSLDVYGPRYYKLAMRRAKPDAAFDELIAAIEEGRHALRGGSPLVRRTVALPEPPPEFSPRRIRLLRGRFGMSQTIFARLLAVSPVTLQKWEQGAKTPSRQSCRLLEVAERHPEIFAERLEVRSVAARPR